jgi:transcriptional regulator with XRE-family HTH domain
MRYIERDYAHFVAAFAAFLQHYKAATGSTDSEIGRQSGLSRMTINRAKRGLTSANLRSFFKILQAIRRDDVLADGVLGVRLRVVNGRQRSA